MGHEYTSDDAGSSVAGMGAAGARRRVQSGDDRPTVRAQRHDRVADGISGLDIPEGDIPCDECSADPIQYRIDHGIECPLCRGVSHIPDPDFYDVGGSFDPYREFSTMPRLHGRGRGQL